LCAINFINNGGSVAAENLSHPDPTGQFALVANNFSAEGSLFGSDTYLADASSAP
jgi:hypothetical protein